MKNNAQKRTKLDNIQTTKTEVKKLTKSLKLPLYPVGEILKKEGYILNTWTKNDYKR